MMRLTRRASLLVVIYVGEPRAICHRPPPASPADRGRDRAAWNGYRLTVACPCGARQRSCARADGATILASIPDAVSAPSVACCEGLRIRRSRSNQMV